ncbi:MAG: response regulator [Elusimicrobia bacterium]|nr:response regulator [Elusimicrobiota bacterium]
MAREVLLVDDEDVFLELVKEQLTNRGFSVRVASTGEEALVQLKEKPPDIVLLDILLAGELNGIDVLKKIVANPETKKIPVIVCSLTMRLRGEIQFLLDLGAKAYVAKPCQPDDLAAKLKEMVGEGE